MNSLPHIKSVSRDSGEAYPYFPVQREASYGVGRDPHEHVKIDPMTRRFPTERHIGIFLFLFSFLLYLASMSWKPFPGLPTHALMMHLKLEAAPSTLDSLWGWVVRLSVHLPGLSVAAWTGLFSAFCGAASVSLLGRLMMRVGYLIRNEPGPRSFIREAQARRLSGVVSGLFLACSIPFWFASTRSLPGSFHVLLLISMVWAFSQYQHWGKLRHLVSACFLYAAGMPEFATFLVFLPLAVFLIAREMFRWKCLSSWRAQLLVWAAVLLGLAFYPFNAYVLYRQGGYLGVYTSMWQALFQIIETQLQLITQVRFSPGFPVIIFFSLVPWLTLFAMSRRSPWFYEWGQVLVRLIFVGGLLAVLFNASFAPWKLLGLSYLMVTPYLLMAVCMGYMAGEFWILGEKKVLGDPSWFKDVSHFLSSLFALFLPVLIVLGGAFNWRATNGREGAVVEDAATEILERLDGRDILFSMGLLDRQIRLAVWEKHLPVRVISAPRTASPVYLKRMARLFKGPLRKALWNAEFGLFLETLMHSEGGPSRIGIIDMPDVFREFGYLVPDGLLYRLVRSPEEVHLPALIKQQRPFWSRMVEMAAHPAPEENIARRYQNQLLLLASKVANNLGVMQAETGDMEGALDTLRTARRIYPLNLSVLLNLLKLGQSVELSEAAELQQEWEALQNSGGGERWALSLRYGYVWRAREWVRNGSVWALSGSPIVEEAAQSGAAAPDQEDQSLRELLDQAYQRWGTAAPAESYYRTQLMRNPRDTASLMSLCRFALCRRDLSAARAYMQEALLMGLPEEGILFDQAMSHVVSNEREVAVNLLEELSLLTPGDARVFLALVLLTEKGDPINVQARKVLKTHRDVGISGHLVLARICLDQEDWQEAQRELERALQIDSLNTQAWEMMVRVAQGLGNPALGKSSLRALLERNPQHYLQFQDEGVNQYRKGDLAKAEFYFREGIKRKRNATLLNNLAHVMLERGEDLEEALAFVNEALQQKQGFPGFLNTRGAIYIELGRFEEAQVDLQNSLIKQGPVKNVLLLLAESYEQTGDRIRALKVAKALARKPDELTDAEKKQVRELIKRVR